MKENVMAEPTGLTYVRIANESIENVRKELLKAKSCILESGVGDAKELASELVEASKLIASVQNELLNHWIAMLPDGIE